MYDKNFKFKYEYIVSKLLITIFSILFLNFSLINAADTIILKNGMKVILQQNVLDEDEILIQLAAPGGYAMLNEKDRASGELSAKIAWESGFGNLNADQIAANLYKQAADINIEIFPLYRSIHITCDQESVSNLLQFIPLIFTEQKFDQQAFEKVITKKKECLKKQNTSSFFPNLQDPSHFLNMQEDKVYQALTLKDLDHVSLKKSDEFFKDAFHNPSEFICVVVGNFDPKIMIPLLEKTLGVIPKANSFSSTKAKWGTFLLEPQVKIVPLKCPSKSLNVITFPITHEMTTATVLQIELCCKIIEYRMRDQLQGRFKCLEGIQASYLFPYFPFKESPCLHLQFCSNFGQCGKISDEVIAVLQNLQKEGPTQEEIQIALKKYSRQHNREKKTNLYWLTTLANYGLMDWDVSKEHSFQHTEESMKAVFTKFFNFSTHTRLSTKPEE